ncbi:MAG: PTS sugar transporter subunit IIA [Alphaproteobacteria bacterium]|nr:PTS sugar transporter subunit IIA [Alphaproteobacteria bacterium]
MTNPQDALSFDLVLPDLKAKTTKQVFQELADHTQRMVGTPKSFLFDKLWEQEKRQSSAIGHGVAVSHARLPRLTRPFIIFTKLPALVDFSSADGELVDMICLVLSPEQEGPAYLKRLSFITRTFLDQELCHDLRAAQDVNDIRSALQQKSIRQQAA